MQAEREWHTPYQSEDPSSTIPTYKQKEEKGKKSRRLYIVGKEQLRSIKKHCNPLLKPASPTPLQHCSRSCVAASVRSQFSATFARGPSIDVHR